MHCMTGTFMIKDLMVGSDFLFIKILSSKSIMQAADLN